MRSSTGAAQAQNIPQEEIELPLLEIPAFQAFEERIGDAIAVDIAKGPVRSCILSPNLLASGDLDRRFENTAQRPSRLVSALSAVQDFPSLTQKPEPRRPPEKNRRVR